MNQKQIINDLKTEIATLIMERDDVQLELDCLSIGKKVYEAARNWDRVSTYAKKMVQLENEITLRSEYLRQRAEELRRLEAYADSTKQLKQFFHAQKAS
jgi:uncharacterized protein (DUF3084 family)